MKNEWLSICVLCSSGSTPYPEDEASSLHSAPTLPPPPSLAIPSVSPSDRPTLRRSRGCIALKRPAVGVLLQALGVFDLAAGAKQISHIFVTFA